MEAVNYLRNLLKRLDYEYIILYFKPNAKSNERHRTSYAAQREHMRKDGFVMLVSEHEYYEELIVCMHPSHEDIFFIFFCFFSFKTIQFVIGRIRGNGLMA